MNNAPLLPVAAPATRLQLTAGEGASWQRVGSMPHRRVMGDAIVLCDGTIGIFNGARTGLGVRRVACMRICWAARRAGRWDAWDARRCSGCGALLLAASAVQPS